MQIVSNRLFCVEFVAVQESLRDELRMALCLCPAAVGEQRQEIPGDPNLRVKDLETSRPEPRRFLF